MNRRFEDLWSRAADDGAFSPVGVSAGAAASDEELGQLMDAWYFERSQRIEGSLLLDQAVRLLNSLMSEGALTPTKRRQAGRMIRAIRDLQRDAH
jgi:hypothetical protein